MEVQTRYWTHWRYCRSTGRGTQPVAAASAAVYTSVSPLNGHSNLPAQQPGKSMLERMLLLMEKWPIFRVKTPWLTEQVFHILLAEWFYKACIIGDELAGRCLRSCQLQYLIFNGIDTDHWVRKIFCLADTVVYVDGLLLHREFHQGCNVHIICCRKV